MTNNLSVLLVAAMAMLAVADASPSFAQTGAAPPATTNDDARDALDIAVTVTAAYDDDVAMKVPGGTYQVFGDPSIAHSNQLQGTANYRWVSRDVQVQASGTSAWLHDRQSGVVGGLSQSGAAGVTARLPWRNTLVVNQTGVYSPSPLYNLFPRAATAPGAATPASPDYRANDFESYSYGTEAMLTHDLTRRSSLSASAEGLRTDYRGPASDESRFLSLRLSGRFTHSIARNTAASARYYYRVSNFGDTALGAAIGITSPQGVAIREQGVEIGYLRSRPLSVSRRIDFDVMFGGSVASPQDQILAGPLRLVSSYRMVGQAGMTYVFAKAWQASAMYRRGVDYVAGLGQPVLTDGVTTRIGGSFTRAVEASVSAGYASGASVLTERTQAFDTYTGDVTLRVNLARAASVYVEYMYYLYDFRGYPTLMPGLPQAFERNAVRAGVTLVMPTLGK